MPTNYAECSDLRLVECIVGGDGEAFEHLLLFRCQKLFRYLRTRFSDVFASVDDVVGVAAGLLLDRNYQVLSKYRGQNTAGNSCKLSTYVSTVMIRWTLHQLEKSKRSLDNRAQSLVDSEGNHLLVADPKSTSNMELVDLMAISGTVLKKREQYIVYSRCVLGESAKTVASDLGIRPELVDTTYSRALKKLRQELKGGCNHGV